MDDHQTASFTPESPDLSNYYAGSPEPPSIVPQRQGYRGSISLQTPYTPGGSLSQGYQPAYSHNQALGYAPPPILQHPQMPPRTRAKREYQADDDEYVPQTPLESTDRLKRLHMDGNGSEFSGVKPVDMGIVVKTKFPVARIKRIMQADDDVGKVAQVTPVVVSKALELFMISLVTKAAAEAKQRSQKRVAATHLKQAITKDSQFDFLEEIVSKVADAPVSAEKNDEDEPMAEAKKQRKTSGRRKKKEEDSD